MLASPMKQNQKQISKQRPQSVEGESLTPVDDSLLFPAVLYYSETSLDYNNLIWQIIPLTRLIHDQPCWKEFQQRQLCLQVTCWRHLFNRFISLRVCEGHFHQGRVWGTPGPSSPRAHTPCVTVCLPIAFLTCPALALWSPLSALRGMAQPESYPVLQNTYLPLRYFTGAFFFYFGKVYFPEVIKQRPIHFNQWMCCYISP